MGWLNRWGLGPRVWWRDVSTGLTVFARHRGRCLLWDQAVDRRQVGASFGAVWARALARDLPPQEATYFRRVCCDNRSNQAVIAEIIRRGTWLIRHDRLPEHLAKPLLASLTRISQHQNALAAGPERLVRIDNNPGNLLHIRGQTQALIDGEQSLIGSRLLMLGVLQDLDANELPGVLQGFQVENGPLATDEQRYLGIARQAACWPVPCGMAAAGAISTAPRPPCWREQTGRASLMLIS